MNSSLRNYVHPLKATERSSRRLKSARPSKEYTHHASKDDPQYEIRSDKTEHIAMHKGSALSKIG